MGRELEVGGTQRSGNIGAGARGISCACAGVEPLRAGTACAPKVSRAARISPGARLCARRTNRSTLAAGDASESYGCLRGFGAAAAGPRRTQPRSLGCGCAARQYNSAKSSCAGRIQPLPWPSATDQRIVADAWLCVPEGLRRKLAGGKPAPRARPPVVPPNGPCPSGASKKFLATVSPQYFFHPSSPCSVAFGVAFPRGEVELWRRRRSQFDRASCWRISVSGTLRGVRASRVGQASLPASWRGIPAPCSQFRGGARPWKRAAGMPPELAGKDACPTAPVRVRRKFPRARHPCLPKVAGN